MSDETRIRSLAMEIALSAMLEAKRWVGSTHDDRETALKDAEIGEKFFSVAAWALEVAVDQGGDEDDLAEVLGDDGAAPTGPSTHVLVGDQPYFGNPAQAMAPDGTLPAGTRCLILRPAGSYTQVRTEDGVVAFVPTKALQPISN